MLLLKTFKDTLRFFYDVAFVNTIILVLLKARQSCNYKDQVLVRNEASYAGTRGKKETSTPSGSFLDEPHILGTAFDSSIRYDHGQSLLFYKCSRYTSFSIPPGYLYSSEMKA